MKMILFKEFIKDSLENSKEKSRAFIVSVNKFMRSPIRLRKMWQISTIKNLILAEAAGLYNIKTNFYHLNKKNAVSYKNTKKIIDYLTNQNFNRPENQEIFKTAINYGHYPIAGYLLKSNGKDIADEVFLENLISGILINKENSLVFNAFNTIDTFISGDNVSAANKQNIFYGLFFAMLENLKHPQKVIDKLLLNSIRTHNVLLFDYVLDTYTSIEEINEKEISSKIKDLKASNAVDSSFFSILTERESALINQKISSNLNHPVQIKTPKI